MAGGRTARSALCSRVSGTRMKWNRWRALAAGVAAGGLFVFLDAQFLTLEAALGGSGHAWRVAPVALWAIVLLSAAALPVCDPQTHLSKRAWVAASVAAAAPAIVVACGWRFAVVLAPVAAGGLAVLLCRTWLCAPGAWLLGAAIGVCATWWGSLRAFGWAVPQIAGVALLALAAVRRPVRAFGGAGRARGVVVGGMIGFVFGALITVVRPFVLQHAGPGEDPAWLAAATLASGAAAGLGLARALHWRPRALVALATVMTAIGAATAGALVVRWRFGLDLPSGVLASFARWPWGRGLLVVWTGLGILAVAFGFGLSVVQRRRSIPAALAVGLALGIVWVDAAFRSAPATELARKFVVHPAIQPVTEAEVSLGGIRGRYAARVGTGVEPADYWQGYRVSAERSWARLKEAERYLGDGESEPDVAPSTMLLTPGDGFRWTCEHVAALVAAKARGESHVACFDLRGLTGDSLRALLAAWRKAAPTGAVAVLADGYSGPLVILSTTSVTASDARISPFLIVGGVISDLLRDDLGRAASVNWPRLAWGGPVDSPASPHPNGAVMHAFFDALRLATDSPEYAVIRGLAIHADAQAERAYVVSTWDHVTMPPEETRVYMEAFRRHPNSDVILRHLGAACDVLLAKREYAVLVPMLEEVVAWRPGDATFHWILGRAYHGLLDRQNAIDELEAAWKARPDLPQIAEELSRVHAEGKDWEKAASVLEDAWTRHRGVTLAKGLGLACVELGRLDRAEEMLMIVAAETRDDQDVARGLRAIAERRAASRPVEPETRGGRPR